MSLPPGAIPFADLTLDRVARADEVHLFDPADPAFHLWFPVTPEERADGATLKLLDVAIDRDRLDEQVAAVEALTRAAAEPQR